MSASTPRVRFNWEDALAQDRDLQQIDAFVKLTISKLPGQPAASADAGRGSRYQPVPPAVKTETPTTMVTTTSASNGTTNGSSSSGGSTPQLINVRDYLSESSSEVDTREVNPMDELSDFEGDKPHRQSTQPERQQLESHVEQEHSMDVEMEEEEEEQTETACEVCKRSDREKDIILCDDCDAEYHTFCLQPPLDSIPDGSWYCPNCSDKHPSSSAETARQKQMQATAGEADSENGAANATAEATTEPVQPAPTLDNTAASVTVEDEPTSIKIADKLAADPKKSNLLLIHACNCDDVQCTDPEFHRLCPHMKRFLRSVCWASHSDKWRTYRLAQITADLFAYHANNCTASPCNVPLCLTIREEEIV
ncbi:hypothetical protein L915_01647 [Phytophthora nicotianae]|uniref:PHD-type domain-containing protein n=5 Tax=Phytophthora nicotianae TaxID=4792 RepID=V9FVS8_PHYNI|nr:hypothetical protein F443_01727 [Phytophthora nicotianae P1569]ETK95418.1 hypothetical protein L915_01647 [Phytophthora nicotianae]ETL48804.1 hypothetical protein L916_01622 [Phytophthora nicotianae]ETM55105.1 hypothetical protein L914_01633 [Phytophthora nicotianae]ETO84347.1 hypothetical protein F444_01729 [Phytophthora nicotianae P1976]